MRKFIISIGLLLLATTAFAVDKKVSIQLGSGVPNPVFSVPTSTALIITDIDGSVAIATKSFNLSSGATVYTIYVDPTTTPYVARSLTTGYVFQTGDVSSDLSTGTIVINVL